VVGQTELARTGAAELPHQAEITEFIMKAMKAGK